MKRNLTHVSLISAAFLLLATVACDGNTEPGADVASQDAAEGNIELAPYAVAQFNAAEGYDTSGNVQFMNVDELGVRVIGRFTNMPDGSYALRILQSGNCSEITGELADQNTAIESAAARGGEAQVPDGGSLGALTQSDGNLASIDVHVDQLALEGDGSIIGKPVIVVRTAEDDTSAPTERSADSIACGVIIRSDVTAAGDEQTGQ